MFGVFENRPEKDHLATVLPAEPSFAIMNDPGLDEPIQETSKDVEQDRKHEADFKKEHEQAFLNPSRWWFASTAFPLLAGTFGPMASAFSVCALDENWRVIVPDGPGANEAHAFNVEDPSWLIIINSISLFLALVANLALLLNMARRLSFNIAQPITIVGWFLSSLLLIALVIAATYGLDLPGQKRALTQAFYYAIIASGLYFIIAALMCVTVWGAYQGHYPQEFKLDMSQRTLMLQTISFMVYMLLGALVYHKVEGWRFSDAVYFTNFTLLTVGIGSLAPVTHTGRALLFPYAIGGIVILGLVIGSIRSLVLQKGKNKLGKRIVEKKREALVQKMLKKRGQQHKLTPIASDEKADELGMTERERRKFEFECMRQIQDNASERQKWNALFVSGSAWLILWLVGAVVFWKAEHAQGWSYFGALYFAYTSLLTIGYGDFANFSNSGKPAFVFWSLLAVPALTIVISNMGDTVVKAIRDFTNYLGEFTVLPGDSSSKQRAKQLFSSITTRFGKKSNEQQSTNGDRKANQHRGSKTEVEAEHNEEEEMNKSKHSYHYLLIREIRSVLNHLDEQPPRRYSYEEWARYLKLMGENEDVSHSHRKPPAQISNEKTNDQLDMQQGPTDDVGEKDHGQAWSWLGNRSPLMGDMNEPEWVLERLGATLEKELKRECDDLKKKDSDSCTGMEQAESVGSSSKTLERDGSGGMNEGAR
ncbi:MAG: hypothetical protein Q9174_005080 [Haloplaca sp. 1 TL-2023]